LNEHAAGCLTAEDLQPCVYLDAELPTQEITFELIRELSTLEPYGAGNTRPVFLARNLCIVSEPRLIGQRHLKMSVAGPESRPLETIFWNGAERMAELKRGVDMAYTIETTNWTGEAFLQLSVQDIRESTANSRQQTAGSEQRGT
jgi:single-stranded-DNA-specific exonuclease